MIGLKGIEMASSGEHSLKTESAIQTAKAAPAVTGTIISSITMNEMVMLATFVYILLQAAYLIWKWRCERQDRNEKRVISE